MRHGRLGGLLLLSIGSLVGCGEAPEETPDQSVVETTSAATSGSHFTLHNYQTGLCLGVAGGTPTWGTGLITWPCDNSANQVFDLTSLAAVPSPFFQLRDHVAANTCVRGVIHGNQALIDNCWSTDARNAKFDDWSFTAVTSIPGHACFNIAWEQDPSQVLGVAGGATGGGKSVILWDNFHDLTNHPDQAWCYYDSTF